jgi:fumarate reductase subunit C
MSAPNDIQSRNVQTEARLWLAQRVSAMILGLAVVVHLGTIIVAVQGGLSAAEIVGRIGGNPLWTAFYAVFVLAIAVHAPIGLRSILNEMTALSPRRVDLLCFIAAAFLAVMGYRVVRDFYLIGGAA